MQTSKKDSGKKSTQETNNADQHPYVDANILLQLAADTDPEIVPELIKLYIEDSELRMQKIAIALVEKDLHTLEFEAHSISSCAIAHGNVKLYKLARKIELACKDGQHQQALDDTESLLEVAKKSFSLLSSRAQQGFS